MTTKDSKEEEEESKKKEETDTEEEGAARRKGEKMEKATGEEKKEKGNTVPGQAQREQGGTGEKSTKTMGTQTWMTIHPTAMITRETIGTGKATSPQVTNRMMIKDNTECNVGADPLENSQINTKLKKINIITQNIRKGFEEKIVNLSKLNTLNKVDILIVQEVNLWESQAGGYKKGIKGYEGFYNVLIRPKPCNHCHLGLTEEQKKVH